HCHVAPGPRARSAGQSLARRSRRGIPMTEKPDCQEIEPLLHGLLDGELDAANTLKCEQHIASCETCANTYQGLVVQRNMIRAANLREQAPDRLQRRVRTMLDRKKSTARFFRPF